MAGRAAGQDVGQPAWASRASHVTHPAPLVPSLGTARALSRRPAGTPSPIPEVLRDRRWPTARCASSCRYARRELSVPAALWRWRAGSHMRCGPLWSGASADLPDLPMMWPVRGITPSSLSRAEMRRHRCGDARRRLRSIWPVTRRSWPVRQGHGRGDRAPARRGRCRRRRPLPQRCGGARTRPARRSRARADLLRAAGRAGRELLAGLPAGGSDRPVLLQRPHQLYCRRSHASAASQFVAPRSTSLAGQLPARRPRNPAGSDDDAGAAGRPPLECTPRGADALHVDPAAAPAFTGSYQETGARGHTAAARLPQSGPLASPDRRGNDR